MNEIEKMLAGLKPISCSNLRTRKPEENELGMNWYDLDLNYSNIPYKSDMVILVTSYADHRRFLKATLTQYRKTDKFIICAYDHHYKGWGNLEAPLEIGMPNPRHLLLAHAWVFKHPTYDNDKREGWFWDVRYAQGIIKQFSNFKYVFCVNGDCLWEKPENVNKIVELLGDGDLISGQSNGLNIHTASVLYKIEAFNKILDYMAEQMRTPVIGSRSPELLLYEAVRKLNLKEVLAPEQPKYPKDNSIDHYTCYAQPSTWREILGYRNLWAELDTASEERLEPPLPKEYLDFSKDCLYWLQYEKESICQYYLTGDRRYILKWWDMSCDDYRDRKYLPLEEYGKEPVYAGQVS